MDELTSLLPLAVSAGGKALLCGGYALLEAGNVGVSIELDTRMTVRLIYMESRLVATMGLAELGELKTKAESDEVCSMTRAFSPNTDSIHSAMTVLVHCPQCDPQTTHAFTVEMESSNSWNAIAMNSPTESAATPASQRSSEEEAQHFTQELFRQAILAGIQLASSTTNNFPDIVQHLSIIELELLASNDFYSQRFRFPRDADWKTSSLASLSPHSPLAPTSLVCKTGLGSSAAITVCLTTAVSCLRDLNWAEPSVTKELGKLTWTLSTESPGWRSALFTAACKAHDTAQGSAGSGFDIFTAVYGTCIYGRRFIPSESLSDDQKAEAIGSAEASKSLPSNVDMMNESHPLDSTAEPCSNSSKNDSFLDHHCSSHPLVSSPCLPSGPFIPKDLLFPKLPASYDLSALISLPPSWRLVLGDVAAGGTNTRKRLVGFRSWYRTRSGKSLELWQSLCSANKRVAMLFTELSALFSKQRSDYCLEAQATKILSENPEDLQPFSPELPDNSLDNVLERSQQSQQLPTHSSKSHQKVLTDKSTALRTVSSGSLHPKQTFETLTQSLRDEMRNARKLFRTFGEETGLQTEPTCLTQLLDATLSNVNDVIGAGCPGAGGWDAVFVLVESEAKAKELETFWESYEGSDGTRVCALPTRESRQCQGVTIAKN